LAQAVSPYRLSGTVRECSAVAAYVLVTKMVSRRYMFLLLMALMVPSARAPACELGAFTISPDFNSYFFTGNQLIGLNPAWDSVVAEPQSIPQSIIDAHFGDPQAVASTPEGNFHFIKGTRVLKMSPHLGSVMSIEPFPGHVINAGFTNIDAFEIDAQGTSWLLQGDRVMGLSSNWSTITAQPTRLPAMALQYGFTNVDSFSIDALGDSWLIKDGKMLGLKNNWQSVVHEPKAIPAVLSSSAFCTQQQMVTIVSGTPAGAYLDWCFFAFLALCPALLAITSGHRCG